MSKELNKAPVEHAGGDERDLQGAQGERDGWGPLPIVQVPWNVFDRAVMWVEDRRRYGDDGTIVDDWKALKTIQRAALAQPSPAPADEKPGDSILCSGCFAKGVGPEHFDEAGKCLVRQQTEPLGAEFAQVLSDNLPELLSTAQAEQAEAERPIVSFEKYMQVMYDRDENAKRLDAALARIAELEAKLSDPTAVHQWQFSNAWFDGSEEVVLKAGKEGSPIRTLYAAPVAQAQHSAPDVCDGKEQNAFEEWASKEGMNMERHPLHWLFLDAKTYSARQGWKAALKYARNMLAAAPVCRLSRSALTEAQMRRLYENSTETENERLGFEAFARLIRRAEAVHQIAAAPGKEVPQAWLDVQAERRRQVEAEGWTPEHDDEHADGQMARAAACYALAGSSAPNDGTAALLVSLAWPWDEQWWKPSTARRDLVKACALALAEIERLDRAGISQSPQPGATTASS